MAKGKPAKELSGGCLSLFGLPFLIGGIVTSWMYFSGYAHYMEARGWEEVPCWIESASLENHSDSDGSTYKAVATYHYEFTGRTWKGDRVSLYSGADNIGNFQQKAHRELSQYVMKKSAATEAVRPEDATKAFRCYVNPDKPSESVLYRTLRWEMQSFMAIFVLTFPAVGAGLVFGGLIAVGIKKRETALKEQYPDEPWKWTSQWAKSAIPENRTSRAKVLHLYTFWSALVIFPLIYATITSGAFEKSATAAFVMIFPALWCIPAWFSLKFLRHRIAVGATRFELVAGPASPGGELRGSIALDRPLPMHKSGGVHLVCEKLTTRKSGDGDMTTTEKIWHHHSTVQADSITRDVSGFRIPVSFVLPVDAPQSGTSDQHSIKHVWKLRFEVPGTAIQSVFEIPVFRTGRTPLPVGNSKIHAPSILDETSMDLPGLLAARRILAEFAADGTPTSLICLAGRNRAMMIFLLFFNIIWTGAAVFLIVQHAPLIFRLVWPVSAAAIWFSIIWQIFHKRIVTIRPDGMEVRNQWGPILHTRNFEKSQILGFSHDTIMSSGNTSFYRVRFESVLGKKTTIVDNITESTTAEVLANRLNAWKKAR
ncbi:MAG: DUF3592 domain-containing protein [Verrucomicrobiota bacterium]